MACTCHPTNEPLAIVTQQYHRITNGWTDPLSLAGSELADLETDGR
jgi:hypothetical protein